MINIPVLYTSNLLIVEFLSLNRFLSNNNFQKIGLEGDIFFKKHSNFWLWEIHFLLHSTKWYCCELYWSCHYPLLPTLNMLYLPMLLNPHFLAPLNFNYKRQQLPCLNSIIGKFYPCTISWTYQFKPLDPNWLCSKYFLHLARVV